MNDPRDASSGEDAQRFSLLSESRQEKMALLAKRLRRITRQYSHNIAGMVGLSVLTFFVAIAVLAPVLVTHQDPNSSLRWAKDVNRYHPPSWEFLFGADYFGKDVYSLTIYGTRASLIVGLAASVISIVLGSVIGLAVVTRE